MEKGPNRPRKLFEERTCPAESLEPTLRHPYDKGVTPTEYEIYYECRGPRQRPVKDMARDLDWDEKRVYELCERVEFRLDRNILLVRPAWAYSLTSFAIVLRHSGKTVRAEDYLKLLVKTLPMLSLEPADAGELTGFAWEHLGGIQMHRNAPGKALASYESARIAFQRLLCSQGADQPEDVGFWKHRALRCELGVADALRISGDLIRAKESTDALLGTVRDLEEKSVSSPPNFRFRGHRFTILIAEIQRTRGELLAELAARREALKAHDEGVRLIEASSTPESAPNQLTASLVKRAKAQSILGHPAAALQDLDRASRHADHEQEYGIYKVFIDRARAIAYQGLGETGEAMACAHRAKQAARRLGLTRQERFLETFLSSH